MLFGHQNDDTNQPAQITPVAQDAGVNPLAVDPATGASLPVAPTPPPSIDLSEPPVLDQPTADEPDAATPPAVDESSPFDSEPAPATVDPPVVTPDPVVDDVTDDAAAIPADSANTDLLNLKQQALSQLSPLVSQLDQSPEEKFRTTMMMIQSTDNQALIKDAYDAAQQIPEEKARAQALLDVINEINYFTQQKPSS